MARASSWATMPPKETPSTAQSIPAEGVEQGGGIVAVVGHRVRALGHVGLAQATLVVGQDLEVRS